MSLPLARLTCQQCQQRKTRCDKRQPQCSACERSGLQCVAVHRQRLPRGKSGNVKRGDPAVKARIARLESLVVQLQQQVNGSSNDAAFHGLAKMSLEPPEVGVAPDHEPTGQGPSPQASTTSTSSSENIAWTASFWEQLSGAVDGLREVLDSPEEDDMDDIVNDLHNASAASSTGLFIGVGDGDAMPITTRHISAEMRARLLEVYEDRVDPVYKAVHWPSVRSTLQWSTSDVQKPSVQAIEYAICFIALSVLADDEIQDRDVLLEHYRRTARQSIERAGIISNKDIAVLQALTLYLEGLRVCQRNDEFWLLAAVAIRLATAFGLDQLNDVPPGQWTTFDYQVKKRLWFCVGMLDLQASFDRPCRTLLCSHDFLHFPLDVDDHELKSGERLTAAAALNSVGMSEDMILFLVICASTVCQRRLGESIGFSTAVNPEEAYNQKMSFIAEHEAFVQRLKDLHPDEQKRTQMQRFAIAVASDVGDSMALFVRRPLQRVTGNFRPPQGDALDVLGIGTGVLESWVTLKTSPVYAKYMWLVWVPWQALAVTLAELCGPRQGPDVDRAWRAVMPAYEICSTLVTRGRSEWLWRPIVTIMRRAKTVRDTTQSRTQPTQPSLAQAAPSTGSRTIDPGKEQMLKMAHGTVAFPTETMVSGAHTPDTARVQDESFGTSAQSLSRPMQGDMDATLEHGSQTWAQPLDSTSDWMAGLDIDAMAWTNWETFVDDIHKPPTWPF